MTTLRPAAVAGLFYPEDAAALQSAVEGYLAEAKALDARPRALIAPHAGYVYSGPVAASAYRAIEGLSDDIRRVVLIGPAHREAFYGIAAPSVDGFATPLGAAPLDRKAIDRLVAEDAVVVSDSPHRLEHCIEVHLPFLQCLFGRFAIVPLLVSAARPSEVAAVIAALDDDETLIVISSDLSHYLDYETARRIDAATARAIEALEGDRLGPEQACGYRAIQGLLERARARGLAAATLDLRNSGDTAGPRDQVVGYGAWAFA